MIFIGQYVEILSVEIFLVPIETFYHNGINYLCAKFEHPLVKPNLHLKSAGSFKGYGESNLLMNINKR